MAKESLPAVAKPCTKCGLVKEPGDFYASIKRRDGLTSWCRDCTKANSRAQGREKHREWKLAQKYQLTPEQYADMLQAQGGRCAIRDVPQSASARAFAVDHDHACCPGKHSCGDCVRGLLCIKCNLGLGSFEDDAERLRSAADYLESHRG